MFETETQSYPDGEGTDQAGIEGKFHYGGPLGDLRMSKPDRRWRLARRLAAKPDPDRLGRAEPLVVQATEYQKALITCTTEAERAGVRNQWPSISEAHAVYEQNGVKRYEVEARLVAGEDDDAIAAKCAMTPAAVAAYEYLFGAIREFQGQLYRLMKLLVGSGVQDGFRDDELRQFWAWAGLTGGRFVVDKLVGAFRATWQPKDPPVLSTYLQPAAKVPLRMQAAIAATTLPPDDEGNEVALLSSACLKIAEVMGDEAQAAQFIEELQRVVVGYAFGRLTGQTTQRRACLKTLRALLRGNGKSQSLATTPRRPASKGQPKAPAPFALRGGVAVNAQCKVASQ